VSRADVIRKAWTDYHAGRITLVDVLRTLAAYRPRR